MEKTIKTDWKYHLKSAGITFLTTFIGMLLVTLESTDLALESVTISGVVGFLAALGRAVVKALINSIIPASIAWLKKHFPNKK